MGIFLEFFTEALSDGNTEFDLFNIQQTAHYITEYNLWCPNLKYEDNLPIKAEIKKYPVEYKCYYDRNNYYTVLNPTL